MKIIIDILKSAAKEKRVIQYGQLIQKYNQQSGRSITDKEFNDMLRLVGDYCIENKMPPLNCLSISRSNFDMPGAGFFVWCGKLIGTYIDTKNLYIMNVVFNIYKSQCFREFEEGRSNDNK